MAHYALRHAKPIKVEVEAPARLHMGFMDMHGGLGRLFGSLGLTLDGMATRVRAEPAAQFNVTGQDACRVIKYWHILQRHFKLREELKLDVVESIPAHVGLGSGTQLALSVGMAVSHLFGLALDARTVAQLLDRGARSGIGVGAFEHGGFLVDGGKGAADQAPPLVSHMVFPQEWRVLLIFDDACQGVHGTREARAFQDLASFPESTAAHLCRLVMMRALPALAEKNLSDFGQAIRFLQHVVGDYFSGVQGGRFASHAVVQVLAWLEDNGVGAVGQSSWGPTGFAVLESEVRARSVLKKIPVHWRDNNALHFKVCCARNRGGDVLIDKASQQRERKIG